MKLPSTSTPEQGFTLIEMLLVIGLFSLIAGLGVFFGVDYYQRSALAAERDLLVSALQNARAQSLSNLNGAAHGVYLANNSLIIFEGQNYASATDIEALPNNPGITHTGPSEITFDALNAKTNFDGQITLSNTVKNLVINVNHEGGLEW